MKKKGKKIRWKGLIFLILVLYLIVMAIYYFFTMPIKSLEFNGLDRVSENDIISKLAIKDETPMAKITSSYVNKHLKDLKLIDHVEVKHSLNGTVTLNVYENKILFYNVLDQEIILENGAKLSESNEYFGFPTLVNYVPSEIYNSFIEKFAKIENDIILMISEIEYSPDKYNDVVIDEERFLLRMNDGNIVYINLVNIEKLNKYQEIFANVGTGGTLYLDSSSKNYIFDTKKDEVGEIKNEDELQSSDETNN